MRTLNISGETDAMKEKRAQHTLELLPADVRTATLLCIYRVQVGSQGCRCARDVVGYGFVGVKGRCIGR